MEYRPLGRTGLNVSALGQGGAAFGQQFGPVSAAKAAACVHAAIDAGVNLVDTAAYYGRGESERILGDILHGGRREKVYVCTKACRLDRAVFDFSPDGTRRRRRSRRCADARPSCAAPVGRTSRSSGCSSAWRRGESRARSPGRPSAPSWR